MNPMRTLHHLRRRVLLHRRPLAALTAGGAVLAGVHTAAPGPAETVEVWTVRTSLPSGTVLQRGDLVSTSLAPSTVPATAVDDPEEVVGRALAAPMARGEVLTGLRTLSRGLLRGYPGTVAVPLRITDADVVGLLRVGDRVSVVVADPEGQEPPRVLVSDVALVAIPGADTAGLSDATPGRLVVAAVPTPISLDVARWSMTGYLSVVWGR